VLSSILIPFRLLLFSAPRVTHIFFFTMHTSTHVCFDRHDAASSVQKEPEEPIRGAPVVLRAHVLPVLQAVYQEEVLDETGT
jgi:hypothetical protein